MQIKVGNKVTLSVPVVDVDGNPITNLATATSVIFMIKKSRKDTDDKAVVTKNLTNGITIDAPNVGDIVITLLSTDTRLLTAGTYYMALEIVYSDSNKQEIEIQEDGQAIETVDVVTDIIRS